MSTDSGAAGARIWLVEGATLVKDAAVFGMRGQRAARTADG